MRELSLSEIIRQDSKFKLQNQEFTLKKFSLLDEAWLEENNISNIYELAAKRDHETILRIAWHQLVEKKKFVGRTVENDEAETIELSPFEAFQHSFHQSVDIRNVTESLLEVLGFSREMQEELSTEMQKEINESLKESEKKLAGLKP